MSKKVDDIVMSKTCDVIVIFSIYGQFEGTWKLDSGCIICKSYIFIQKLYISLSFCFRFSKTENNTKESQKNAAFLQKSADINKTK